MSNEFVVGFMCFLAGAIVGIVWKTISDVKYDRQIMASYERMCNHYKAVIDRKNRQIRRMNEAVKNGENNQR